MTVYTVPAGPLRANSYLITQDGENAVLIDCGGKEPLLFAKEKGLSVRYVLLTHGTSTISGGCAAAQEAGGGGRLSRQGSAAALFARQPCRRMRAFPFLRSGQILPSAGENGSLCAG